LLQLMRSCRQLHRTKWWSSCQESRGRTSPSSV
jgi:hypothetical protein